MSRVHRRACIWDSVCLNMVSENSESISPDEFTLALSGRSLPATPDLQPHETIVQVHRREDTWSLGPGLFLTFSVWSLQALGSYFLFCIWIWGGSEKHVDALELSHVFNNVLKSTFNPRTGCIAAGGPLEEQSETLGRLISLTLLHYLNFLIVLTWRILLPTNRKKVKQLRLQSYKCRSIKLRSRSVGAGIEGRALYVFGKHSPDELYTQLLTPMLSTTM